MLKMVDGTGIIGVDMVCPLGGTVSPPQPPNYDMVEVDGTGMLVLPNSLDAPLERLELSGKTEQVQTTGAQLFDIAKCPLEHNGISFKIPKSSGDVVLMDGYVFEENAQYTISAQKTTSKNENSAVFKFEYVDGSRNEIKVKDIAEKSLTSMSGKTVKRFLVVNPFGAVDEVFNFQFEKGVTATPYEPYTGGKPSPSPEYPQEIVNAGRLNEDTGKYEIDVTINSGNLFKLIEHTSGYYVDKDGKVQIAKALGYSWTAAVNNLQKQSVTLHVTTAINTRYRLYCTDLEDTILYKYEDSSANTNDNSHTFNMPDGAKKIYVSVLEINSVEQAEITLNLGNVTLPYEPYKEQTLTLTSDRPITKWDRLVEQGGQIGWLYQSNTVVIDGSETWSSSNVPEHIYFTTAVNNKSGRINTSLCKTYKNNGEPVFNKKHEGEYNIYSDHPTNGVSDTAFVPPNETVTTIPQWKEWLNANPIEMLYKTKTTEFIPLPQSEQNAIRALKTYYPTTVITAGGGELDPDIKVTYRKEI